MVASPSAFQFRVHADDLTPQALLRLTEAEAADRVEMFQQDIVDFYSVLEEPTVGGGVTPGTGGTDLWEVVTGDLHPISTPTTFHVTANGTITLAAVGGTSNVVVNAGGEIVLDAAGKRVELDAGAGNRTTIELWDNGGALPDAGSFIAVDGPGDYDSQFGQDWNLSVGRDFNLGGWGPGGGGRDINVQAAHDLNMEAVSRDVNISAGRDLNVGDNSNRGVNIGRHVGFHDLATAIDIGTFTHMLPLYDGLGSIVAYFPAFDGVSGFEVVVSGAAHIDGAAGVTIETVNNMDLDALFGTLTLAASSVVVPGLPTADPGIPGALWVDAVTGLVHQSP